eukprot:453987-Amphidinium_carterae.1
MNECPPMVHMGSTTTPMANQTQEVTTTRTKERAKAKGKPENHVLFQWHRKDKVSAVKYTIKRLTLLFTVSNNISKWCKSSESMKTFIHRLLDSGTKA